MPTIEVFGNLVHVSAPMWDVFCRFGVQLATSWYSDDPGEHAAIVGSDTHGRTLENILKAQQLGVPVRGSLVRVLEQQRVDEAREQLTRLGISTGTVGEVQPTGRAGAGPAPRPEKLCGRCPEPRLAVMPSGLVHPCLMSRWLIVGDVRRQTLAEIVASRRLREVREDLEDTFARRPQPTACAPDNGGPPPPPPCACPPLV